MAAFEDFGVMPEIIRSVEDLGWSLPTPIQSEAIPLVLGGGDVLAAAETGSGKTGAFALPILQVVHETLREKISGSQSSSSTVIEVKLNHQDRDNGLAISEDGLMCQTKSENAWMGCRTTVGVTKGKYYYEATVRTDGICRVGWSTRAAKLELGTDQHGFGFGATAKKSNNRQFVDYGTLYGNGDIIGCFIDLLDKFTISFSKNGTDLGVAFEIPNRLRGFGIYPAVAMKNSEIEFNFGQAPFKHLPTSGGYEAILSAPINNTTQSGAETGGGTTKVRNPIALILEPTRELAEQTHNAISTFMKYMPPPQIGQVLTVGGISAGPQTDALKKGTDIVTGTPGRIIDLIQSGTLLLADIRFFVLDEADKFLESDALSSSPSIINQIFTRLSDGRTHLQVLLFSATLHSPEIKELAAKLCRYPIWVDLKGKDSVPETVRHGMVWANIEDKKLVNHANARFTDGVHKRDTPKSGDPEYPSQNVKLVKPLLVQKVIDSYKMNQALIFVRTKVDADNLEAFFLTISGVDPKQKRGGLIEAEYSCAVLHGDRNPQQRRESLEKFKAGEVRFLVCTDVAARGIDVKELPYVINVTLPDKPEDYIHRVGRVGRADNIGLAISIVAPVKEKVWYHSNCNDPKQCHNTSLTTEGGCCIWYDEPTYLKAIEERLGGTKKAEGEVVGETNTATSVQVVALLDPVTFRLQNEDPNVVYGQKKDAGPTTNAAFLMHAEILKPTVADLYVLEDSMQKNFWSLKKRWNGAARKGPQ